MKEVEFRIDNLKAFEEAARLAPKKVMASIKREGQREAEKFKTEYRKTYFFGLPGINIPARLLTFTKKGKKRFKKRTNRDAKTAQLQHVRAKVITSKSGNGLVLVGYLSKFATFHAPKLEAGFYQLFRRIPDRFRARASREAQRITQAILDKGLRDHKRGSR